VLCATRRQRPRPKLRQTRQPPDLRAYRVACLRQQLREHGCKSVH
jgi:hypothetical protein